ncbi:MAG TPA: alpha/beta fold hydrolase [Pseudobdellovibrionaceae bacterium]|nr:alpha/beta fold hydrolase [Pseudobdellovibrionaceae bacterium]
MMTEANEKTQSDDLHLVFLHGFLGEGADWKQTVGALSPSSRFRCHCPDYVEDPLLGPLNAPLESWGRAFGRWMRERQIPPERTLLVGYSQGGRLALQALESSGLPLRGVVLLSVNPGFPEGDLEARAARVGNDEAWARRFQEEPWEATLKAWNRQGVFEGSSVEPCRERGPGDELLAAASLRAWSLSHQQDFRGFLRRCPEKIYWMTGEKDVKFVGLWKELQKDIPSLRGEILPSAGHRILFDQPRALAERLALVLKMQF